MHTMGQSVTLDDITGMQRIGKTNEGLWGKINSEVYGFARLWNQSTKYIYIEVIEDLLILPSNEK